MEGVKRKIHGYEYLLLSRGSLQIRYNLITSVFLKGKDRARCMGQNTFGCGYVLGNASSVCPHDEQIGR